MSNLFFQFPHLGLLGVSLLLLLNGIFSKRLILQIISVLILVYAGYREILSFNPDTILHLSLDLILISILAFPAKFIDSKLGQVIYLLMALGLMGAGHSLIQNNHEEDQSIEIKLDPDAELLVQFDNIRNLQTWKNKNKDRFDIEYPVFTPADEQYGLDEYIAINLTEDQLKEDYIREINDAQGIIHVEYNEQYSLDLPVEEAETSFQIKSELNDPGVSNQWMADRFKLDKFHEMISSRNSMLDSEPSIIAILDTGVDGNHEDLAGNYVSTKRSYDSDSQGHGTHCAGIAAAVTG
ncbi:MAG: S8 family serine peptidase, partial [Bacteroidia bacterium]|nr:S8 family serine peptidase [Bacteroidia bacterium]